MKPLNRFMIAAMEFAVANSTPAPGQAAEPSAGPRFPLVYSPHSAAPPLAAVLDWFADNRARLEAQLKYHGAILFRGFPLVGHEDFDCAIRRFNFSNFPYAESMSNALRRHRTERVFTANEAPPAVEIYLHHELAQTPDFPRSLFFFCEAAPDEGGATPLCRSDWLLARLRHRLPEFVARCGQLGVRYISVMAPGEDRESGQGRGWRAMLAVADRRGAEERLQSLGFGWTWLDGDLLRICSPALAGG